MKVDMSFVPDGKSGNWSISTFTVEPDDFTQKISFFKTYRSVPGGTYKRLLRDDVVVMSNTPDEIRDFIHFTSKASGNILINGLGLGCVLVKLLEKEEVEKITIIEKSQDVINLVAPHFNDSRIEIIHADAFTYKPPKGVKYNYVWHDIWDYICSDNLKEMTSLHRKYGKRTSWQDSWAKKLCQRSF